MRTLTVGLICFAVGMLVAAQIHAGTPELVTLITATSPSTHSVVVVDCRASDGDGIVCGRLHIRVVGFDAFEICELNGPAARDALQVLVAEGLTLRFVGKDRYGRPLAKATTARGIPVEQVMIGWQRNRTIPRPVCPR